MNPAIQTNVSLQPHNSMAVPAKASHLLTVETQKQLVFALDYAQQHDLVPLVLGEGTNTLFTQDYNGLVILNRLKGIDLLEQTETEVLVRVGAGENWHAWVLHCLENGWHGLENLALIPGMVGAAPMQNIGAYGVEVKDCLESVELLMIEDCTPLTLSNRQCDFAYRDSVFKHHLAGRVIVTAVIFRLAKCFEAKVKYPALGTLFDDPSKIYATQLVDAICHIRMSKLPLPSELPNSGSFFKNPVIPIAELEGLKRCHPNIVYFEQAGAIKLAAAWLIEQAGWKLNTTSAVHVHSDQALVIVNPGKKSGAEVLAFAAEIQSDISEKYGVTLEIEPRIY